MIRTIAFDADDTLWHNEDSFQKRRSSFRLLCGPTHDDDWINARMLCDRAAEPVALWIRNKRFHPSALSGNRAVERPKDASLAAKFSRSSTLWEVDDQKDRSSHFPASPACAGNPGA